MIKFDKNFWFFYYIICLLFIFNIALIYRIPFILPLSGLIILCIMPGLLLCLLFEIKVTDTLENFLFWIGLSIVFDLLFGLLINTILPIFGERTPLSSQNLQILFSTIILILTSMILYKDKVRISFAFPKFQIVEKILLILGFIMLFGVQTGIYLVNTNVSNLCLILSIFLIPLLLFFLIVYHNNSIKRIYPIIIYLISFSLLMLLTLRSNYIIGTDSHEEYYFFYNTFIHSIWIPDAAFLLSAALSISLLPTIFENFLNIDPQLIFKILFPLLFSVTPLIIFVIAKRYIDELVALFASCFFMFQIIFVATTYNSRTSIGIFFFAFAVLVFCNNELANPKKYALSLLFIAGTIFSHYTTSLIFLFIILLVYLIDLLLIRKNNLKENRFVNFPLIIFFLSLVYFWFQQIINNVFNTSLKFALFRSNIFKDLLINDVGSDKYTLPVQIPASFLLKFSIYMQYILFAIIGLGILIAFYSWFQKEILRNSMTKFPINIDRTLLFMGVIAFGLLFCTVFAPLMFFGYDNSRISEQIFIILSVFLGIGAYNFFNLLLWKETQHFSSTRFHKKIEPLVNYCKINNIRVVSGILLILLIPQLLLATSLTNLFDQGPSSIIYNSPKYSKNLMFEYAYSYDEDAMALHWFNNNSDMNAKIFSDGYGNKKIVSMINKPSVLYQKSILEQKYTDISNGYIFLTVTTEYYGTFINFLGGETKISSLQYLLNQKNKIFSNGAVLYK